MITERALVFQKIRVRYARNVVLYSLPESPDITDDSIPSMLDTAGWDMIVKTRLTAIKAKAASKESKLTTDEVAIECKKVVKEGRDKTNRALMGLFSSFDGLVLERFVGTEKFRKLLSNEAKEVYTVESK